MQIETDSSIRRLFILAGFDPQGKCVDASFLYYAKTLSDLGDLIVYFDNDLPSSEIQKLAPYAKYVGAKRHNEYDFGSYKRGFNWAQENLDLASYEWVYFINDSVYGPLYPLAPMIGQLESSGSDAVGIAYNPNRSHPHIQSYFIGLRPKIFLSKWFNDFIASIKHQDEKGLVTKLYEQGLTDLIIKHEMEFACTFAIPGRGVYNDVKKLYRQGFPFLKKASFVRHNGALGRQINYILRRIDPILRDAILENAKYVYGAGVVDKNLTNNIFKIIYRNLRHAIHKLFTEGV